jgi:Zn-dependent M28 family amino/carboxypeptidase
MSLPFPSVHVALNIYVNREEKIVENVIGMIPGSDSTLRNEYLVITSHYDHLGKHSITQEIFHGADDDASGTSALLEIAQGMAAQNVRPKRSVIFLAATGEEKGLLGSIYYTRHPLIPLGETVANLNIDMVGRIDPSHDDRDSNYIYIIGSDRLSTDLHKLNELANKESANLNLDYRYNDKTDSNKFYERSDHYNFAKRGVPIIFYFNGVHEDYHMPSDRSEKILYPLLLRRTQLIYWTGWKIATAPKRPAVDIDADFTTPLPTP